MSEDFVRVQVFMVSDIVEELKKLAPKLNFRNYLDCIKLACVELIDKHENRLDK